MNAQDLKNSILQLAVQGRLVEQREEEGTAEKLYQQIKEEKSKLVREGKVKKSKNLPEITEDEISFDIPASWKWVRLGEVGETNIGLTYKPSSISNNGTIVLRSSNIYNGELVYDDIVKVEMSIPENKMCKSGDILICARNGSKRLVGKAAIIDKEGMSFGAFMAIYRSICNEYVLHVINSTYFRNALLPETGTTTINQITQDRLRNFVLPLPPLKEQKRIVAKIEELIPYVEKYDKAYSKVEELNKKFPEDMQKSILQYAIQGKLVEQLDEEGTAEELFQQIQEEKAKLIKEGKIKKTKALPVITEDEIPYDIPENWKWVRLGEIVSILGDGIHGTPVYDDKGDYYFINGNNLNDGKIEFKDNTKRVNEDQFIKHKRELNESTVLVSINGTIGNVAFYGGEKVVLGKSACYFNLIIEDFKYYLYWVIKTKYFLDYAFKKATGTTIKNVSLAAMKEVAIPLPPLEEQKRIVEKLEELLPYAKQLIK
ncbi:restriction endonuclease subunit S [Lederbergia citri]|uniref:Restriction endonuclease subunit S n=1 Tax=Lederbergia citri TaxID=2833580 RepID=A0A942TAM3_9BACI|nr:restriction endonuclease subunit S [Lederbergia citri]MBS4194306.1 restriction endonuclease subunit S [Lederbergia citri]